MAMDENSSSYSIEYSTSVSGTVVEAWLRDNCETGWEVVRTNADEGSGAAAYKVTFEKDVDKTTFETKFKQGRLNTAVIISVEQSQGEGG